MVPRVILGEVVRWPVFGPVAFAGIGTLPAPILSRSIVMHIQRKLPNVKFDVLDIHNKNQMDELAGIKNEMMKWALSVNLNTALEMPTGFEGRRADKWRVLFAIADSLGRGSIARKAAIKFGIEAVHVNELLLIDIRKVFDKLGTKRIPSYVLVEELIGLEDPEYDWSEFKGTRPLTVGPMSLILRAFQIHPKSVWWPENVHRSQQCSIKGYARKDFEVAWKRYNTPPPL